MAKETNFNGEFGWELLKAVPYAYNLHLKGELTKTISCSDTKCLYYFSENHEERHQKRSRNDGAHWDPVLPFGSIHRKDKPDEKHWTPPPYKEFYRGKLPWERPTVVISNKYNEEWRGEPVNFISEQGLVRIIESLAPRFKVYYNRPTKLVPDNSKIFDMKEKDAVRRAGATLLEEEYETHKDKMSFNTFQMCVFADCERFVSIQGGTSILSSYFGGKNLILARRGHELECGSYSWYPFLSGSKIWLFGKEESMINKAMSF